MSCTQFERVEPEEIVVHIEALELACFRAAIPTTLQTQVISFFEVDDIAFLVEESYRIVIMFLTPTAESYSRDHGHNQCPPAVEDAVVGDLYRDQAPTALRDGLDFSRYQLEEAGYDGGGRNACRKQGEKNDCKQNAIGLFYKQGSFASIVKRVTARPENRDMGAIPHRRGHGEETGCGRNGGTLPFAQLGEEALPAKRVPFIRFFLLFFALFCATVPVRMPLSSFS
jgi:hypothetical protein